MDLPDVRHILANLASSAVFDNGYQINMSTEAVEQHVGEPVGEVYSVARLEFLKDQEAYLKIQLANGPGLLSYNEPDSSWLGSTHTPIDILPNLYRNAHVANHVNTITYMLTTLCGVPAVVESHSKSNEIIFNVLYRNTHGTLYVNFIINTLFGGLHLNDSEQLLAVINKHGELSLDLLDKVRTIPVTRVRTAMYGAAEMAVKETLAAGDDVTLSYGGDARSFFHVEMQAGANRYTLKVSDKKPEGLPDIGKVMDFITFKGVAPAVLNVALTNLSHFDGKEHKVRVLDGSVENFTMLINDNGNKLYMTIGYH